MNRKSTSVFILVRADVLTSTATRLKGCHSLLMQSVQCALDDGLPTLHTSGLLGIGDLLTVIHSDLKNEIGACLDAGMETRRKNGQRT